MKKWVAALIILLTLTGCVSKEAKTVIEKIDNIGAVSEISWTQLMEIGREYNELSEEDKESVKNYEQYEIAVKEYHNYMVARITAELNAASELETSYFAQYYDLNGIHSASDKAKQALETNNTETFEEKYSELKLENEALKKYIDGENERVFNECLADIKNGLEKRLEAGCRPYTSFEEYENNIKSGVDIELDNLAKYKDIPFVDKTFDDIIEKYILALENESEGMDYVFSDANKYNELYIDNGYNIQGNCVKQLQEFYGLKLADSYTRELEKLQEGIHTYRVAQKEQSNVVTKYGEVGVAFIGYDILKNPADEMEMVLYCSIENISYQDEYNEDMLIVDDFLSISDGEGYNIHAKGEAYGYIDGYEECAGIVVLRQGEKGKFAIMYDYTESIDVVYAQILGVKENIGCYVTLGDWEPETERPAPDMANNEEVIKNLEELLDAGILTQEEFEEKKAKLS